MEALATARVTVRKPQLNFAMPPEMRDAWEGLVAPYGARRGSTIGMAALLMFMNSDPSMRETWIERVASAEAVGKVGKLLPPAPAKPHKAESGRRDSNNARRVPMIGRDGDYKVDDGRKLTDC